MGRKANKPEDVWKFVDKRGADECWPWISSKGRDGYGAFRIKCRYYKAHRVTYFVEKGGIELAAPESNYSHEHVLHSCDNPSCCNPSHLFLGDIFANMADKVSKGRQSCIGGEVHYSSRLTNADAERIREAAMFGARAKDLASSYGVGLHVVYPIIRGETYRG